MRAFGNIISRIMEASQQPVAEVGMGATVAGFSDRYAATVVEAHALTRKGEIVGYEVVVRQDKATRADANGMSDLQSYTYEPDPAGRVYRFRLDKAGTYREVDEATGRMRSKRDSKGLILGERRAFYDYSF